MYGLSNEQLVFIYYSLKKVEERYDMVINSQRISQEVLGLGKTLDVKLPKELLDDLSGSDHYQMLKETVHKLTPIFELIDDVEPEMCERIKKVFE